MPRRFTAATLTAGAFLATVTTAAVDVAGNTPAAAAPAPAVAAAPSGADRTSALQLPRGCSLLYPTGSGYTGLFAGARPVRVDYAFPRGAFRHGAYVSAARDRASHEIVFLRDGRVYDSNVRLVGGDMGHGARFRRTYRGVTRSIPDVVDVEALPAWGRDQAAIPTRTLLLVDSGGRLYGQRIGTSVTGAVALGPARRLEARGLPPLRSLTPVGRMWDRRKPRYATGHTVLAATKDGRVVGLRISHRPTTHVTAVTPFLDRRARATAVLTGSCFEKGRTRRLTAVVARDGRVTAFLDTPGDLRSRGSARRLAGRLPSPASLY